ncbi:Eukaryotic translation initiation factor 2A, partial [Phytophthora megakarya]
IATAKDDSNVPRTKFFLRGKGGVEAMWGPPSSSKDELKIVPDEAFAAPGAADLMEFSEDGKLLVLVRTASGFTVHDADSGAEVVEVTNPGIHAVAWSPLGSQLLTWQRPHKDSDLGNLIVWDAVTGKEVARFNHKAYTRDKWPPLQWSSDETICARQSANGVVLYSGRDIGAGSIGQINLPNVANFSVAPGSAPYKVALFVPEKKGKPATVKIYQFPTNLDIPTATKSFYKAQDVMLKWSPTGSALIIETRTDIDTSGKSYYGETGLFFLQSDGEYDCIVPLTKEGTVHDVAWDPTGRGFVVIAGAMPAHATLYDNKALPVFEFGAAPRNHVSWSPHGRFLCLAGFGNLRGDMDFWERNKLKKMGSATSNSATTFAWSPDSRYFATGTTFPRLRVDNGFKVFRYDGSGPIHQEERGELYDLKFRPAPQDTYPNRPQSPRRKGEDAGFGSSSAGPKAAPKPQAYRPPNSTGALAAMMRKEEGGSRKLDRNKYAAPRAAASSIPGAAPRAIPGMGAAAAPKKLSKSARKKKAQEAAEAKAAVEEALAKAAGAAPAQEEPAKPSAAEMTPEEKAKKVKNLLKKLKQIDVIKAKKEAGDSLNDDQLQKLTTEQTLRDEVAVLSA